MVYLAPTIRFKYRAAQAAKRGETIKRYESFVTKTKPTTYGEVVSDPESPTTANRRDSRESLLDNDHMSDGDFGTDEMDTSLLADMGTNSCLK